MTMRLECFKWFHQCAKRLSNKRTKACNAEKDKEGYRQVTQTDRQCANRSSNMRTKNMWKQTQKTKESYKQVTDERTDRKTDIQNWTELKLYLSSEVHQFHQQTDRVIQTGRQTNIVTDRQTNRLPGRLADRQTSRLTDWQTDRPTDWPTDQQTDQQTDWQTKYYTFEDNYIKSFTV